MMGKVKILGISSSPRSNGASAYLLNRCLEAIEKEGGEDVKTSTWSFHAKKMAPCLDCGYCFRKPGCVTKDDFQQLQELWMDADVVVYSVPVYHLGLPGQLKCFIDRLGQSSYGPCPPGCDGEEEEGIRYLKVVAPIAVGMHQASGQEKVLTQLIDHALVMQCVPVTGDPWQCYTGAAGWTQNRESRNPLIELEKEGDYSTLAFLKAVETLGIRALQMAYLIRGGMRLERKYFEQDSAYRFLTSKMVATDGD